MDIKELTQTAFTRLIEKSKSSDSNIKDLLHGDWDLRSIVEERIGGSLEDPAHLRTIPSLNSVASTNDLKEANGKIVRFTGFVQDILDQDYFLGVVNTSGNIEECPPHKYFQPSPEDMKDIPQSCFLDS